MAEFLRHEPCPKCGSSDNLARYSDGSAHCFGCQHYERGEGSDRPRAPKRDNPFLTEEAEWTPLEGEVRAVPSRGFDRATCAHWNHQVAIYKGELCRVHTTRDERGAPVRQKIRLPPDDKGKKRFKVIGTKGTHPLYGMHLWPRGGKRIAVTEGEDDALAISQAQENKWPVVSLPDGAQQAAKCFAENIEYLSSFETVVIAFDSDEPGQKAAKECAALLPPGKAVIAQWPAGSKDANDLLMAGRAGEITSTLWRAQPYKPDSIVSGSEVYKRLKAPKAARNVLRYPWPSVDKALGGIEPGRLVVITAGSGCGKSELAGQIAYGVIQQNTAEGRPGGLGYLALEEDVERTGLRLMSVHAKRRLHIPEEAAEVSPEEWEAAAAATILRPDVHLYDAFGSTEVENIVSRIRFMAQGLGCKTVILDHLSIVISGLEVTDERKAIDMAMTKLRTLVQETGITLFVVVHLNRPEGNKGFEEGLRPSLKSLRGSHAIAQLADTVLAGSRDQQADDPTERNTVDLYCLKHRFNGFTGKLCSLRYGEETGLLTEADAYSKEPENPFATEDAAAPPNEDF